MSWKIYYAWKVEAESLAAFVAETRERVFNKAKERITQMMGPVPEAQHKKIYEQGGFYEPYEEFKQERELPMQFRNAMFAALEASHSIRRDWNCVDAYLNIWFDPEDHLHFYVIPGGDIGRWGKFEPKTNGVKEYGWWNNTDEPDGMSEAEWSDREKLWRRLVDNHDIYRMNHIIIELKSETMIGGYELENMILNNPKDGGRWSLAAFFDYSTKEKEKKIN